MLSVWLAWIVTFPLARISLLELSSAFSSSLVVVMDKSFSEAMVLWLVTWLAVIAIFPTLPMVLSLTTCPSARNVIFPEAAIVPVFCISFAWMVMSSVLWVVPAWYKFPWLSSTICWLSMAPLMSIGRPFSLPIRKIRPAYMPPRSFTSMAISGFFPFPSIAVTFPVLASITLAPVVTCTVFPKIAALISAALV